MLTFEELMQDVGAWAAVNFEQSWCSELPLRYIPEPGDRDMYFPQAGLGSLAPLLGIGEEIGELNDAVIMADDDQLLDAVGDILVYLCDWCYRERLPFPVEYSADECEVEEDGILNALSAAYGRMLHCKLKRCQKIRSMDNDPTYQGGMHGAMTNLMCALAAYMEQALSINDKKAGKHDLLKIANDTWNNVVSKRNWKAWPRAGVQHG